MPRCSTPRASGSPPSPRTTARSLPLTTPIYILAFHRDPSRIQASRRSMPPSNPPKPGTSSTSLTPRVTTITPGPTKSSPASSSNTVSSSPGARLLLLGGEGSGEPAVSVYKAAFAAAGIKASCEARTVAAAELPDAIARIRADRSVLGAAISMPHTVPVSGLLDGLGPEAQVIKAVNTVSHRAGALVGWNTDRPAFSLALEDAGFQAKGRAVLVLGAGGAARASVDALRDEATKIWVSSRDRGEARAVCRDLEISSGGPAPLGSLSLLVRKVDLVVNATPVGSDGEAVPFPFEWIPPAQFVFDLVYRPLVTRLGQGARGQGAARITGRPIWC